MINEYRLPGCQRQSAHTETQPHNVENCRLRVQRNAVISVEDRAVENQNDGDDLAAEAGAVAEHEKSVGVLY